MQPVHITPQLFLAVLALVFFVLAGLGIPEHPRIRYIGWGLTFLTLAFFVSVSH